jgi:hypothetical protein
MDPFHLAREFSCVGLEKTNKISLLLAILQCSIWFIAVRNYSAVVAVCFLVQAQELLVIKVWSRFEGSS